MRVKAKQVRVAFHRGITLAWLSSLTYNLLLSQLLRACLYLVSTSSALSDGFRREVYSNVSLLPNNLEFTFAKKPASEDSGASYFLSLPIKFFISLLSEWP